MPRYDSKSHKEVAHILATAKNLQEAENLFIVLFAANDHKHFKPGVFQKRIRTMRNRVFGGIVEGVP